MAGSAFRSQRFLAHRYGDAAPVLEIPARSQIDSRALSLPCNDRAPAAWTHEQTKKCATASAAAYLSSVGCCGAAAARRFAALAAIHLLRGTTLPLAVRAPLARGDADGADGPGIEQNVDLPADAGNRVLPRLPLRLRDIAPMGGDEGAAARLRRCRCAQKKAGHRQGAGSGDKRRATMEFGMEFGMTDHDWISARHSWMRPETRCALEPPAPIRRHRVRPASFGETVSGHAPTVVDIPQLPGPDLQKLRRKPLRRRGPTTQPISQNRPPDHTPS